MHNLKFKDKRKKKKNKMPKTVLVTGGSGLIGQGIKMFISQNKQDENYIFLSSKDCDEKTRLMFFDLMTIRQ